MDPLRKYKARLPSKIKYLPIKTIDEKNLNKFTAYLNGAAIEVTNPEQIEELQNCGCFGDLPFRQRQVESHYLMREGIFKKPKSNESYDDEKDVKIVHLTTGERDLNLNDELLTPMLSDEMSSCSMVTDETCQQTLTLNLEEAFFLHYSLKCLTIYDSERKPLSTEELFKKLIELNSQFLTRFVAYHYYRGKNYVVRSGIKFGSDFIIYHLGPKYYHARYMVLVKRAGDDTQFRFPSKETLSWYRIGETCNKECVLLEVKYPDGDSNASQDFSLLQNLSLFKVNHVRLKRLH